MASPAASADVQPSVRRSLRFRSKTAAESASHRDAVAFHRVAYRFVQQPAIAIDQQQVPVARRAAAGHAALDVVVLGARFDGNRVAGQSRRAAVALAAVAHERQRHARLIAGHDDVRDAVGMRSEIGVQPADRGGVRRRPAADPADQLSRTRVDRRAADVHVPPVVDRKHTTAGERLVDDRRSRRADDRDGQQKKRDGQRGTDPHIHRSTRPVPDRASRENCSFTRTFWNGAGPERVRRARVV